ncbi:MULTISPECIES: GNAT family N-acetyltransferase [Actinoplanes]|uniref:GNAT family N-acetyltransferase n=1 Tax=Actinoplanes TaxID=1865 RepID=UPI0005F2B292|nr:MULTISPECIES: GNAT family N-acetyltransferase [Actinoplanes]GLY04222.1 GNAT family acetyltransferase [Actinoplanes sp. NBRC 101535]
MNAYLETDRLTLRHFTADDADLLTELDSDPAVMRYLTGGEPTPPDHYRERGLRNILACYEKWNGDFGLFAAYEKGQGAFIGWFHLRPDWDGPLDEVELGYRLRQAAWGNGYATEGSRALLAKGFTELGVRLAWGETMCSNVTSQKVLEKAGMTVACALETPPDMLMVEGAEQGGLRYEISREQWGQR